MTIVLTLLLIAAMGATAYVLFRGVTTMAKGGIASSEQQQQWMRRRVLFQALAIVIVVVILLFAGSANR